jgi:hypothetical protein
MDDLHLTNITKLGEKTNHNQGFYFYLLYIINWRISLKQLAKFVHYALRKKQLFPQFFVEKSHKSCWEKKTNWPEVTLLFGKFDFQAFSFMQ